MNKKQNPLNESWNIYFFQRHPSDDPRRSVPAQEYLDACTPQARAKLLAALKEVASAPPPKHRGYGRWEAMHGNMGGFYEIRADGVKRRHYRLFCILERNGADHGLEGPSIIVIAGKDKPFRTTFTDRDYAEIKRLGEEYRSRSPRSVVLR